MFPKSPDLERIVRDPTPRDRLIDGRVNLRLAFKAKVCRESYVFTRPFMVSPHVDDRFIRSLYRLVEDYFLRGANTHDDFENLIKAVNSKLKSLKVKPPPKIPRYDAKVIIPASALKGVVRSRIEYKLSPKISCYCVEEQKMPPKNLYKRHLTFWGKEIDKPRGSCSFVKKEEKEKEEEESRKVCIVCDLFGSPGLASRIYFSDLEMVSGKVTRLQDLGIEVIAPQSEFKSTVNIINCDLIDLGLLFLGLELYSGSPILLGAYKYRYNPSAGGLKYRGNFIFGALRFQLEDFSEILTNRLASLLKERLGEVKGGRRISREDLIKAARLELEDKLRENVFFDRGVIKVEC